MTIHTLDGKLLFVNGELAMGTSEDCCCCIEDCDGCCTGFSVPTEIVVDLGTPGLTPGAVCDPGEDFDCTDITGEFTLTDDSNCEFVFTFDETSDFCGTTGIPGFDGNIEFLLTRIFDSGTCAECYWKLEIYLGGAGTTMALYESPHKHFAENDCTLETPVTLTKTSENWGSLCTGTMPATITIEAAP